MTEIDPDIDHLYEAAQQAKTTPTTRAEYLARGQVHALIAIAQELRKMNGRSVVEIPVVKQWNHCPTQYPYGRQV